jgi:hypothetical protein
MTDATLAGAVPRPRVPGPPSPAVAFGVVALVYGGLVAAMGIGFGADSQTYSAAADRLIASGFDYATTVAESRATYPPVMYVGFATLVALLKLLLGAWWTGGLVALNVLAAAGVAALLAGITRRATDSAAAAWAGLGLMAACFDLALWPRYVLSDATFLFVAFAVFALAADRVLRRAGSWVPVFALAGFAAFYRPTGVVLIPAAAWALFLARSRPGAARRAATAALAGGAVLGTFVFAWIMQRPSRWPLHALSGTVDRTAHFYSVGEVVSGRPASAHAPPVSVADYAAISADRFVHFFAFTTPEFSLLHDLLNAAFFVPAYALALWLAVAMLRGRDGLSQAQRDVFLAAAGFVAATALFHGLLQVDYDWRYRVPVLPHLALLAAGGVAALRRGTTRAR